jgi:hypothetical protein
VDALLPDNPPNSTWTQPAPVGLFKQEDQNGDGSIAWEVGAGADLGVDGDAASI